MKKILFSICALAAAAVSCTKSEVLVSPTLEQPITFDTYIGKAPMTKGETVDLEYLQGENKGFRVLAFLHTNDANVDTETSLMTLTGSPYMDKHVWWSKNNNSASNIPNEIEGQTKVVFSTSENKPTQPDEIKGEFSVPDGWSIESTSSTYFCVYTKATETTDESTTIKWSPGEVTPVITNTGGSWMYDGVAYWPDANGDKYLAFMAYGVNTKSQKTVGEGSEAITTWGSESIKANENNMSITFNVQDEVSKQEDLIVAPLQHHKKIDANATNTTVPINFKHMLSRVGFQLKANQTSNVEIKVTRLELKGSFAKTGTVNLNSTNPVITPAAKSEVATSYKLLNVDESNDNIGYYSVTSNTEASQIYVNNATWKENASEKQLTPAENTSRENCFMMIMPSDASTTIEVDYVLTDAEPRHAIVDLGSGWKFEAGKSYNFILTVSTSAIGFVVQIEDWDEAFDSSSAEGGATTPNGTYPLTQVINQPAS